MHDIGVDTDSGYEYLYKGDFSESSGYDSILYMIGHYSVQPTAIISANNTMCIGILKALYAQGLQVPEQYSVACFNGLRTWNYIVFSQPLPITVPRCSVRSRGALPWNGSRIRFLRTESRSSVPGSSPETGSP